MPTNPGGSTPNPERLMLAYLCARDAKNLREKVDILDRFGLSDADIAKVCNGGLQAVRNARLANKKGT
jgi:hypothetical protein